MTREEREQALEWFKNRPVTMPGAKKMYDMAIEALKAQDDSLDEWCTDCKEYDQERHCCPRFNRVIRTALQDSNLHSACTEVAQDTISRQTAIDVINQLINEFEEICSHIRERNVDDSVCGLCEYDGAYIGQSGDWCNECPGFDKDDCFKLKDEYRQEWLKQLPSAEPEIVRCKDCIFHGLCRTSPKWAVAPKDDWYCADAERRTDEQTV